MVIILSNIIDLTTLTCGTNCNAGYTRMPIDWTLAGNRYSVDGNFGGLCSKKCDDFNIATCQTLAATIAFGQYYKSANFTCKSGYTKVNYQCIPTSQVARSKNK